MPNQDASRVSKISWSMVSKVGRDQVDRDKKDFVNQ